MRSRRMNCSSAISADRHLRHGRQPTAGRPKKVTAQVLMVARLATTALDQRDLLDFYTNPNGDLQFVPAYTAPV